MTYKTLRLIHILAFGLYGAAVLARYLLIRSGEEAQGDAQRQLYQRAASVGMWEHMAIGLSLLTGIAMVALVPTHMQGQGWLHAKLTVVLILFVITIFGVKSGKMLLAEQAAGGPGRPKNLLKGAGALVLVIVTLAALKPF